MGAPNQIYDSALLLKDAGAVTTTGQGTVASVATILDLGATTVGPSAPTASQILDGNLILDVTNIKISAADETYEIFLQFSNSATFASGIFDLATAHLGSAVGIPGTSDTGTTVGRYIVPFRNEWNGVAYRYCRIEHVIGGTSPTINYSARLTRGS